jgi:hypothetical protein
MATIEQQIGESAVGAFATMCRASAVNDKENAAVETAQAARFFAARLRKLLRMMQDDPSLGCTIGGAIDYDAAEVLRLTHRAVTLSIEADTARRELEGENAAKGETKP